MFNLNENDRIVIARHPTDIRIGINGMCGQTRSAGLDPTDGSVYISESVSGTERKYTEKTCRKQPKQLVISLKMRSLVV